MSAIGMYRKARKKVLRFPLYLHLKKDFHTRGYIFAPTWNKYLHIRRRQMRDQCRLVREALFWKKVEETHTERVTVTTWLPNKDVSTPYICPCCGVLEKRNTPLNLRYETVMLTESEGGPPCAFEFVLRCHTCNGEMEHERMQMKDVPQRFYTRRLNWSFSNNRAVYHLSYRVSFSATDSYMHHEERYRETHELHWEKATLRSDEEIVTDRGMKCVSEVAIEGYILEPTHPLYETVMNIVNVREFPQA